MSTKQEIVSDATFRAQPFSSDFKFCMERQSSYCSNMQILLSIDFKPYHYQVAKSSILSMAEFLDLSLKMLPCMKTSPVSCENQSFFLLFQNVASFIKSHCLFLCYFLQYDEVLLISLLDGCYHYLNISLQTSMVAHCYHVNFCIIKLF